MYIVNCRLKNMGVDTGCVDLQSVDHGFARIDVDCRLAKYCVGCVDWVDLISVDCGPCGLYKCGLCGLYKCGLCELCT